MMSAQKISLPSETAARALIFVQLDRIFLREEGAWAAGVARQRDLGRLLCLSASVMWVFTPSDYLA